MEVNLPVKPLSEKEYEGSPHKIYFPPFWSTDSLFLLLKQSCAEIDKQIEKEIVKLREKIKERLKDGKKDSESFPWESDPIVESVLDKDEGSGVYKDGKKISP